MDVLVLIERLDDLVKNAKAVPLSTQVRLDRRAINGVLDDIRAVLPEEVKQARALVREQPETTAETRREIDRLIAAARQRAGQASSRTEVERLAQRHVEQVIAEARRQANSLQYDIDEWAEGTLAVLEANLATFLAAVRRGRERLPRATAGFDPSHLHQHVDPAVSAIERAGG